MSNSVEKAMANFNRRMSEKSRNAPIRFAEYLQVVKQQPETAIRNVFQVFHDFFKEYLGKGEDEYDDDPESIKYVHYDTSRLFERDTDRPFFADRLFTNRLVQIVSTMRYGSQQNKIYIFNGPPGCGKSTFLNTLLKKFESYCNAPLGRRYEVVWRLDPARFGIVPKKDPQNLIEQLRSVLGSEIDTTLASSSNPQNIIGTDGAIEIPCPSHDHPLLLVPKDYRKMLLEDLLGKSKFKQNLFFDKEYTWVFRDKPCTFCSSLYQSLLNIIKDPEAVNNMVHARPYQFNRRLGEGISIFNPGDQPDKGMAIKDPIIQGHINALLKNYNEVQYMFSPYARTNNGIYSLMDIKGNNTDRLIELHNIISEGVHKVEHIEESVSSLLIAVMNPEDQRNIKDVRSFTDRIEYINIPYVLDQNTEVKIYRNTFGKNIDQFFLPRVLNNFARVVISTRMSTSSKAMNEWIKNSEAYQRYCDKNLQLLRMEIYRGNIPNWLSEEDRKKLTATVRRRIINEADTEGTTGISGRDSIRIFNDFLSAYQKKAKIITMPMLIDFFGKRRKDIKEKIPEGFLESIMRMYNYSVLQEVKESLYFYNDEQIDRDILNYLFAVNFEPPASIVSNYTGEKLNVSESFFQLIEDRLLGEKSSEKEKQAFRSDVQHKYTTRTLTQELLVSDKQITKTDLFLSLRGRYVQNIKQKVLDPLVDNENFRRAIKDFHSPEFKTYDKRLQEEVVFLLENLQKKFTYSAEGAREVCLHVIDSNLPRELPS